MHTKVLVPMLLLAGLLAGLGASGAPAADGRDLEAVRGRGVLRHVGVPYAHFVVNDREGLDVEVMQRFAAHLGLRYELVRSDWDRVLGDLTGSLLQTSGGRAEIVGRTPVRGDVVACGLTVLLWRKQVLDFSRPVFPTQIWLVSRSGSPLPPIASSGDLDRDIVRTRARVRGLKILCKLGGCLDPAFFRLEDAGAEPLLFAGGLNDLAPAMLFGEGDAALLDAPDALVALEKWPGQVKVIGPMSPAQDMAAAFSKDAPKLRRAFDDFFQELWRSGEYLRLVRKYYPLAPETFPQFFR